MNVRPTAFILCLSGEKTSNTCVSGVVDTLHKSCNRAPPPPPSRPRPARRSPGPADRTSPPVACPSRAGSLLRGARNPARERPAPLGGEVHRAERVRGGGVGVGPARARGLRRRLVRTVPPHCARRELGLPGIV
jgi:hypothetical protein